ncbi:MAG: sugar transferase [Planctomycetaceae bacterium]|jgi:lipopolysaccharide/colanic/teichoic acid biosynthesis glycosyltransferase|nr:sugar transferase [Planctomycetaceae bacterium]
MFDASLPPKISRYYCIKRYIDFILVFFIALVLAPLILFFVLLVFLTSRGPIFYSQIRCGKNGKPFKMYKIRSMIVGAETDGITWAQDDDQRVTKVGQVMRKLHIDELVQLYNVLRGEMALVGPRPERPEFVEVLRERVPCYEYRMLVLPGMSGLSQLNYSADTGLEDVHRKLILDMEYIEDASFGLDMRMLAGTFLQFLCTKFSKSLPLKIFGVYRTAETSHWVNRIGLLNQHQPIILPQQNNKKLK